MTEVFTDGACIGNGSKNAKAGAGVFFGEKDPRNLSSRIYNGDKKVTNQVAELTAALMAIRAYTAEEQAKSGPLTVVTDSEYLVNSMNKWAINWEKNGWITAKKTPVLNSEILKALYSLKRKRDVKFRHVYAHLSRPDDESKVADWQGNAMADKLAMEGITSP